MREVPMKICPKCQIEHEKQGTYCSRKCANSRSFTVEARQKKSVANKKHYETFGTRPSPNKGIPRKKEDITKREETRKKNATTKFGSGQRSEEPRLNSSHT